jgi:hypothetical protein
MKLLIFILMICPFISFGQISTREIQKEVKVGSAGNRAELTYSIVDGDTLYRLKFRIKDEGQRSFENIQFPGANGGLDSCYATLKSFFTDEHRKDKDYKVTFMMGNTHVVASNIRGAGANQIRFWTSHGVLFLDERQIDKLFGK